MLGFKLAVPHVLRKLSTVTQSPRFLPCFSRASQGCVEAKASKLRSSSKRNLSLFYRDLYIVPMVTLPATCVQEPSHGPCPVKSPGPIPKYCCILTPCENTAHQPHGSHCPYRWASHPGGQTRRTSHANKVGRIHCT